jgi:serine/threonine protein kinase
MEYEELVSRIVEKSYSAGADIYTEGEETEPAMFFVRSGIVAVVSEDGKLTRDVSMGGYFGVTSTIFHKLPCASAKPIGDVNLGILSRADIKAVIRTVARLNQDPKKLEERASKIKKYREIPLASLKKHRILGVGTFGKVWLVSREYEGKTEAFALKIQRKRQLIKFNQVQGVIREIKVMLTLEHPFILSMLALYQDDKTVMMLLNLVQGGELYGVMKKHNNMMLPERDSKFYASCILEGLHYMHYHSILYRDLKPENVLIDKDGYAVIVDLGFAKEVKGKTFTLCGTPWYIAPEVVLGRGHDKACDYWSWGILIHEMCTGDTPFQDHGADQMTLFKGIVKGKYRISNRASKEVADLVKKILEIKPQYRLGNLAGGAKDIKTHDWLKDVNFNKLSKKVFRAPWTPTINDPLDVEAFDNWDHMEKDEKESPLTGKEQKLFAELVKVQKV